MACSIVFLTSDLLKSMCRTERNYNLPQFMAGHKQSGESDYMLYKGVNISAYTEHIIIIPSSSRHHYISITIQFTTL